MQQVFFAFEVAQVMAGPQQRQQLLAGPRAAVAVEGQAVDGIFPAGAGGGLDLQVIGCVAAVLRSLPS